MRPIRLAAWHAGEGRARVEGLRGLGFRVDFEPVDAGRLLRTMAEDPPPAVVIDLSRSPAQGRDLGVALRIRASTRGVSLVFAGGLPSKVAMVKEVLPDARFCTWEEVGPTLDLALKAPPQNPVVPDSALAGYSGTPLPKKLGIREGSRVLLVAAPSDFLVTLGPLPDGVRLLGRFGPSVGLILWFVQWRRDLDRNLATWASRVGREGMWILWPKKSSGMASDLQQAVVRRAGLEAGLVDFKIAAVDETWSGLRFALRK